MLLGACSPTTAETAAPPATLQASADAVHTNAPSHRWSGSPTPSPTPTAWDGGGEVPNYPDLPPDPQRATATDVAVAAMEAFARPTMTEQEWWADFRNFLTTQAVLDFTYTDPAEVPAHRVTGPARVIDSPGDTLARIQVPTDIGSYLVILTRSPELPQWRVDRLLPPETRVGD